MRKTTPIPEKNISKTAKPSLGIAISQTGAWNDTRNYQKQLIFFLIHAVVPFKPFQMVTKENPQKRPSDPPNSANKEVKG